MNRWVILLCLASILSLSVIAIVPAASSVKRNAPAIIPQPLRIEQGQGVFTLTPRTGVYYFLANTDMKPAVEYLVGRLRAATGFPLEIHDAAKLPQKDYLFFNFVREEELGNEGHVVRVTRNAVDLEANGTPGFFFAGQTILQLLPPEVFRGEGPARTKWSIPCVTITDKPRFPWRGMMLDVSRHFQPKEFVKRYIDELAMHKMNVFHWHLTDDQGWRIEVKRYPELTRVSAWRVDRSDLNWSVRPPQQPGEKATYGGYYTQEEIREVVRYAAERFITVVPEIEMPAHVTAVLAAYPQYSCTGGPFTVPTGGIWPLKDIYCAGNDSTFIFLENVLSEVIDLFPGTYLHIGGDEANKAEWKRCPKCQARIKAEGLKDEGELQSYFIKRIEKFLKTKNRRLIGWDEILEGGLAPEATVMSWRGTAGGIQAARAGHDVVMTPTDYCYIDYYQGDPLIEPIAIGGFLPLKTVYSYEPVPDSLTSKEAGHVLGLQGNLWAEFIPDPPKAEYMAFPRIAAIAEVGWSAKTKRNWDDFAERLSTQLKRYAARGIIYAKSAYNVSMRDSFAVITHSRLVQLQSEIGQDNIHYTLNGTEPTSRSPLYKEPIRLSRTTTIKAATFREKTRTGDVTMREFPLSMFNMRVVSLNRPFDTQFQESGNNGLVDNVRASLSSRDRNWHGMKQSNIEAVIDLGGMRSISRITSGFYQNCYELIFLPPVVEYAVSVDGKSFEPVATVTNDLPDRYPKLSMKDFSARFPKVKARYIRVLAKNIGLCPVWHKQAGQPAWLYVDEVFAE
jgi:hexosaminidase